MIDIHSPDAHVAHQLHLRKEASTMALYVAVCLLAALTAAAENAAHGHVRVIGLVWGVPMGLAIAHLFAFRVSARLVAHGTVEAGDVEAAGAQLLGAAAVALLATVPVFLLPSTSELDAVRLILAFSIALMGFLVAKESGAKTIRSVLYGVTTLIIATAIAVLKNVLSGH
jgi:hypothetical protein